MNLNLTELRKRIEAGLILTEKHPTEDLHIYNYTKRTQYERVWDEYTKICRGLENRRDRKSLLRGGTNLNRQKFHGHTPHNLRRAFNPAITGEKPTGWIGEIPESPITQINGFCETANTQKEGIVSS